MSCVTVFHTKAAKHRKMQLLHRNPSFSYPHPSRSEPKLATSPQRPPIAAYPANRAGHPAGHHAGHRRGHHIGHHVIQNCTSAEHAGALTAAGKQRWVCIMPAFCLRVLKHVYKYVSVHMFGVHVCMCMCTCRFVCVSCMSMSTCVC